MNDGLRQAASRFVDAYEAVFHEDWAYTRLTLGVPLEEPDAETSLRAVFGEPPRAAKAPTTFLLQAADADSVRDWGNLAALHETYVSLCSALGRNPVGSE